MSFLSGKNILITGLLSNRSIAYGIAKACHAQGAQLAFTFQNERFEGRVREMAAEFGSEICIPLDVAEDAQIESAIAQLGQRWTALDGLVHAIAFAPREAIAGDFLEGLSREAFTTAHEISAYSFPALAKAALPLMSGRPSAMVTLSYLGSVRMVPAYNTMGLAKASLEAAVRYMASSLGPKAFGSTASPQALSRPWPQAASRALATSSRWSSKMPPCGAMSPSTTLATSVPSCCPTSQPV